MIYITGDIHGDIDIGKLNTRHFPDQKNLSKNDYLIICGDFGLVWDGSRRENYWRNWLSNKPFTTLWIDGNHENFDMLENYPITKKFGGVVREITPSIFHLERGQVLNIDGKTIFVMGGAQSHDKRFRKEHISWWEQEFPNSKEIYRAISALQQSKWEVDYVVTHCAPTDIQKKLCFWYEDDRLTSFFERVKLYLKFKQWYFGHYHVDTRIGERFTALYNKIITIQ